MNSTRLILSIIAVFIGIFATDFLIHGVWLAGDYKGSAATFRTDDEMGKHFGWILLYQFVCASILSVLWAKTFANRASVQSAAIYGSLMGAFFQSSSFVSHAVFPLPSHIMTKWIVAGIVQMTLMGILLFFVYKPPATAAVQGERAV
jgi:hypothetical protein